MNKMAALFIRLIAVAVILFGLIQLIPYGREHTNPQVVSEPTWDNPQTRQLAVRACFDCHSNETIWPWYSHVAPVSWLLQRDVEVGRRNMNFSEWNKRSLYADRLVEVIQTGKMPPYPYLIMHPEARLSKTEQEAFIQGLLSSLGDNGG